MIENWWQFIIVLRVGKFDGTKNYGTGTELGTGTAHGTGKEHEALFNQAKMHFSFLVKIYLNVYWYELCSLSHLYFNKNVHLPSKVIWIHRNYVTKKNRTGIRLVINKYIWHNSLLPSDFAVYLVSEDKLNSLYKVVGRMQNVSQDLI